MTCACGCGESPNPGRRYVRWHNRRGQPNPAARANRKPLAPDVHAQRKAEIARRRALGWPVSVIAGRLGMSPNRVYDYLGGRV